VQTEIELDSGQSFAIGGLLDNRTMSRWFNPAGIQQLLDQHDSGKFNHGKKLWALVIWAVWLKKYISQR
jgi:asparagine synthase (glutamine-hydrolysing)